RSMPPWTATVTPPSHHAHACETALAELQHAAVDLAGVDVQLAGVGNHLVESDAALRERPARLRGGDRERPRQQRRQVDDRLRGGPIDERNVGGQPMLKVNAVKGLL